MGSYASFNDVHHGTRASDLADHCTACFNTGYVEYPISVGVHVTEQDPCPYGCMDAELLSEMLEVDVPAEHLSQYKALQPELFKSLPEDLESAYYLLHQEYKMEEKDPFLTFSQQFRLRGFKRYQHVAASHRGMVSSDDYIPGFMRSGREVHHISIPPYLVARVLDFDAEYAHLEYEYLGSKLQVWVSIDTLRSKMRFAHSWDRDFSTRDMIG